TRPGRTRDCAETARRDKIARSHHAAHAATCEGRAGLSAAPPLVWGSTLPSDVRNYRRYIANATSSPLRSRDPKRLPWLRPAGRAVGAVGRGAMPVVGAPPPPLVRDGAL